MSETPQVLDWELLPRAAAYWNPELQVLLRLMHQVIFYNKDQIYSTETDDALRFMGEPGTKALFSRASESGVGAVVGSPYFTDGHVLYTESGSGFTGGRKMIEMGTVRDELLDWNFNRNSVPLYTPDASRSLYALCERGATIREIVTHEADDTALFFHRLADHCWSFDANFLALLLGAASGEARSVPLSSFMIKELPIMETEGRRLKRELLRDFTGETRLDQVKDEDALRFIQRIARLSNSQALLKALESEQS